MINNMAKFLYTDNIVAAVAKIIRLAETEVYLISPYVDLSKRYKNLIKEKNKESVHVTLIWGKKKTQYKFDSTVKSWMNSMENVDVYFKKELHAKCFLNEKEAIITSMNLYEASKNNVEMGILITKDEDKEAYTEIFKEVKRLIKKSKKYSSKSKSLTLRERAPKYGKKSKEKGYCIRCGKRIKLDVKQPYCLKDWRVWRNKGSNKDYVEKEGVCHICGKSNRSSLNKPTCREC